MTAPDPAAPAGAPVADPPALFEVPADRIVPKPVPPRDTRTPGEKLRDAQAERMSRGLHPLSMPGRRPILLHADAAPPDDHDAEGLRCGSCALRQLGLAYGRGGKSFPKCMVTDVHGCTSRASRSLASDVRAWWPACVDYKPKKEE